MTVTRDGTRKQIHTPRPVHPLEFAPDGEDLTVTFAERARIGPRDNASGSYSIIRGASRLRLPRHEVFGGGLAAEPEILSVLDRDHLVDYHEPGADPDSPWTWITREPALVMRFGERVGQHVWWLGADPQGDRIHRHACCTATTPSTATSPRHADQRRGIAESVSLDSSRPATRRTQLRQSR